VVIVGQPDAATAVVGLSQVDTLIRRADNFEHRNQLAAPTAIPRCGANAGSFDKVAEFLQEASGIHLCHRPSARPPSASVDAVQMTLAAGK